MKITDQFEIDDIQEKLKHDNNSLKSLIVHCLMSDIFRSS
jgi:hypothetical protein